MSYFAKINFNDISGFTSFGAGLRITLPDGITPIEIIQFNLEGSDHKHDLWEHATLLSGQCKLVMDSRSMNVKAGETIRIAPGIFHRMIPQTTSYWLIWYAEK